MCPRKSTYRGINKSNRALSNSKASVVNSRNHRTDNGRGARGPENETKYAIDLSRASKGSQNNKMQTADSNYIVGTDSSSLAFSNNDEGRMKSPIGSQIRITAGLYFIMLWSGKQPQRMTSKELTRRLLLNWAAV